MIFEKEAIEKWQCLKQGKQSWDMNNKEAVCRSVYKDFFEGWWRSFVPEMLDKIATCAIGSACQIMQSMS